MKDIEIPYMPSFLYEVNHLTGELTAYSYAYLDKNIDKKIELHYKQKENDNIKYYCGCLGNKKLEMKFYENGRNIYRASQGDNKMEHFYKCCKHSLNERREYNPGFKEDKETNTYTINLEFNFNHKKTDKKKNEQIKNQYKDKMLNYRTNCVDGKISTSAFAKNLNVITQEKSARRKHFIQNTDEFTRKVYGLSSDVFLDKKNTVSLRSIMYDYKKAKALNKNEFLYLYKELDKIEDYGFFYKVFIKSGEYFSCSKDILDEALRVANIQLNRMPEHVVVSGFLYKDKYIKFADIAFMRTNKYGLYSESSYEDLAYNFLTENRIPFYKTYKELDFYDGHIPDATLINKHNGKNMYLEVFGYTTDEYLETRKWKIEHINKKEISNYNEFVYWSPCTGEGIEDLKKIIEYLKGFNK